MQRERRSKVSSALLDAVRETRSQRHVNFRRRRMRTLLIERHHIAEQRPTS